jgi:hypothetical protein
MAAATKHLTPLVLELGGKCPVLVDSTADLDVSRFRFCLKIPDFKEVQSSKHSNLFIDTIHLKFKTKGDGKEISCWKMEL